MFGSTLKTNKAPQHTAVVIVSHRAGWLEKKLATTARRHDGVVFGFRTPLEIEYFFELRVSVRRLNAELVGFEE